MRRVASSSENWSVSFSPIKKCPRWLPHPCPILLILICVIYQQKSMKTHLIADRAFEKSKATMPIFFSAVRLFNFSRAHEQMWRTSPHDGLRRDFQAWILIAARDGAMWFGGISQDLKQCATVWRMHRKLRKTPNGYLRRLIPLTQVRLYVVAAPV
jgi:hypothetical protein